MNLLRTLPKVDTFIKHPLLAGLNSKRLMDIAKNAIEALRKGIQEDSITAVDEEALALHVKQTYEALFAPSLKPLINATGVILHTNMGRSVIAKSLLERASDVICNYSNLEYNLKRMSWRTLRTR